LNYTVAVKSILAFNKAIAGGGFTIIIDMPIKLTVFWSVCNHGEVSNIASGASIAPVELSGEHVSVISLSKRWTLTPL